MDFKEWDSRFVFSSVPCGLLRSLEPCFQTIILIVSYRWTTEEQPMRIGLWMCGASVGSIVGQAFDYAAASIQGQFKKSPWKWIYLLLGSMTVVSCWGRNGCHRNAKGCTSVQRHLST